MPRADLESARADETRVAIFLPSLESGGVQRMFAYLARAFAEEHGLLVDMVLAEAKGPHLAEVPPAVRVIDLKRRRQTAAILPLSRYLVNERPAALLTGMPHSNVVAVLARSWARAATRVVISEHSLMEDSLHSGAGLSWRIVPPFIRRYYRRADAVVAVSAEAARQVSALARLPRQRVTVIHNAVLTAECMEKMEEDLRHPWFASGAPPVVLSVGRLVDQKDFPTLIRAFARVRAARVARLLILGEGPRRPQLQALCDSLGLGDDVALAGHVNNPYPFFPRAAVFVLPSAFEGFGNVLVEAMAAGTPVVATRCGGPMEILEDGRHGRLVPVGGVEEMARAIHAALDEPADPAALKARADEFSVTRVAPRYLQCMGLNVDGAPAERPISASKH